MKLQGISLKIKQDQASLDKFHTNLSVNALLIITNRRVTRLAEKGRS